MQPAYFDTCLKCVWKTYEDLIGWDSVGKVFFFYECLYAYRVYESSFEENHANITVSDNLFMVVFCKIVYL